MSTVRTSIFTVKVCRGDGVWETDPIAFLVWIYLAPYGQLVSPDALVACLKHKLNLLGSSLTCLVAMVLDRFTPLSDPFWPNHHLTPHFDLSPSPADETHFTRFCHVASVM